MNTDLLQTKLEESGELMVHVEEFDEPIELHLHDTTIDENVITVELDDGMLWFESENVTGAWKHFHSTDDYGL